MQDKQEQGAQDLRLYIAYDDYLNAEQLSALLSRLDKLYNYLYTGYVAELSVPLPLETRMRIKQCHTGQSIEVWITEGIRQIWDVTGLHILGPIGVAGAMARLIIGFAKPLAEIRKIWEEAHKTRVEADAQAHKTRVEADAQAEKLRAEAEKLHAEAEKLHAEAEHLKRETKKEPEKEDDQRLFDLSKIPVNERRYASEAVIEFFAIVEDAPNIREMRINDEVVYKNADNQNLRSEIYVQ